MSGSTKDKTKPPPSRSASSRGGDKPKDDSKRTENPRKIVTREKSIAGKTDLKKNKEDDSFHKLCFEGDLEKVKSEITKRSKVKEWDINEFDSHGNTALHLAIHNKRIDVIKQLLSHHSINSLKDNSAGWSPLQAARATKDRQIIEMLYKSIQLMARAEFEERLPKIVSALEALPDFTLELKWDLTTWIPLVSRYCPSDVYTIYKKGTCVRLDATLVGYENYAFQRGSVSFIFNGESKMNNLMFIHHDEQRVEAVMDELPEEDAKTLQGDIDELLEQPIINVNSGQLGKLTFTPQNSWSGEIKTGTVAGYDCKLFTVEGLSFGLDQRQPGSDNGNDVCSSWDEYLKSGSANLIYPNETIRSSAKEFPCSAYLTKGFPLKVPDLLPVFEVLAPATETFAKIKKLFEKEFPVDEFPLKIELPVFPTVTATVVFNSYSADAVSADKFEIPANYKKITS